MSRQMLTGILDRQTQLVHAALDSGLFDRQDIANLDGAVIVDWFLVTDDLAVRLAGAGQVLLANEYGTWWGCASEWLDCLPNLDAV